MTAKQQSEMYSCQRQTLEGWISEGGQDFGDVTSLVNALRNRRMYRFASLRLLEDLVDVTRGTQPAASRGRAAQPASDAVLEADKFLLDHATKASPTLFRSLSLTGHRFFATLAPTTSVHRILLCQQAGLDLPTGALSHVLAAAIARQFDEPAAAVTFDGTTVRARVWVGSRALAVVDASTYLDLRNKIIKLIRSGGAPSDQPLLLHLVVAAPQSGGPPPRTFASPVGPAAKGDEPDGASGGYDRIVYLANALPEQAPAEWTNRLTAATQAGGRLTCGPNLDTGPYFSSFVVSLISAAVPGAPQPFATRVVDDEFQTPHARRRAQPGWRLDRDQCQVPFDMGRLRSAWDVKRGLSSRMINDPHSQQIADRWARAVTNRRVGMALSGGGAASYRLIPIIVGIHDHVPIDLVSGVSGGSLVGAYYCHSGLEGLERCVKRGRSMGFATLACAAVDSDVFRRMVDRDLDATAVTDTDTRLAALTTAMYPNKPPAAHVVTGGTLGEAVQVSGAAPLLFAPIVKVVDGVSLRFADGATAAFVPARILRDCGADFVFAFNCLPGPRRQNPLDRYWIGRLLYDLRIIDRFTDLWVSASYLAQRIGRETNEDAHVYFEPKEDDKPLLDSFQFTDGHNIVKRSAATAEVKTCIQNCIETWQAVRRGGAAA